LLFIPGRAFFSVGVFAFDWLRIRVIVVALWLVFVLRAIDLAETVYRPKYGKRASYDQITSQENGVAANGKHPRIDTPSLHRVDSKEDC
jgi:hypothetical protein